MYHKRAVEGRGLHTGLPVTVTFEPTAGPVRLRVGERTATIAELAEIGGDRSTAVEVAGARIGTVEHLFAALAARGIRSGLTIAIDGSELPILDGCAATWAAALEGLASSSPSLRVARAGSLEHGGSRYDFVPAEDTKVSVTIDFGDARLAPHAAWDGDPEDFVVRIATARTFGFAHEVEMLLARGLAQHVAPESVVVIAPDVVHAAGKPFAADEPARHKLLDLLGDLYLHGGPFRGHVHATRPGHAATHAIMRQAIASRLVVPVSSEPSAR